MANNRTEAIAQVDTKIVPTVTNTIHRDVLNNDLIGSLVFRKDVIGSETPSGGSVTIDYSDKDLATVPTTSGLTISFTNLENGDVKYLKVTKSATNSVSFSGAVDVTEFKANINNNATSVVYQVFQKNAVVYVRAIREQIIVGDESDIASEERYKLPSCEAVFDYVKTKVDPVSIYSSVNDIVNQTNWSLNQIGIEDNQYTGTYGYVDITIQMQLTCLVSTAEMFNVTSAYTPLNSIFKPFSWYSTVTAEYFTGILEFAPDGTISKTVGNFVPNDIIYVFMNLRYRHV